MSRADLHLRSRHSPSGSNWLMRQTNLRESYTDPADGYAQARSRGMDLVTLTDLGTVNGCVELLDDPDRFPGAFCSVELAARFADDDLPVRMVILGLEPEDLRALSRLRRNVVELVDACVERGLAHYLCHPLSAVGGPPPTVHHLERCLLLFRAWETRSGSRPVEANHIAGRIADTANSAFLAKLADAHALAPRHDGPVARIGGSDDHGAIDTGTTWTDVAGAAPYDVRAYLGGIWAGDCEPGGDHGGPSKLAHTALSLFVKGWTAQGGQPSPLVEALVAATTPGVDGGGAATSHRRIRGVLEDAVDAGVDTAIERATPLRPDNAGGIVDAIGPLVAAATSTLPYLAAARHFGTEREHARRVAADFFGRPAGWRIGKRTPRVAMFTDTFGDTNGAAGTMRRLAAWSAARDGRIQLVTCDEPPLGADGLAVRAPGAAYFEAGFRVPLPLYEELEVVVPPITAIAEWADAQRIELVHCATPGPMGLAGLLLARLLGVPAVATYHTELPAYVLALSGDPALTGLSRAYMTWFHRSCARVFVPSRAAADSVATQGVDEERLRFFGRGVEVERFGPEHRRTGPGSFREAAGVDRHDGDERPLALFVGRVSKEKGLDTLAESFEALGGADAPVRLAIVGEGPYLMALRKRLGDRAFLPGPLHGDALAEAYASADLFVFPSATDTFGQVVLEAQASGLPAIVTDQGGPAELVGDEENGLVVPAGDATRLAQAICRLAAAPGLRTRLARKGRALARHHTWDASFEQLIGGYREVLDDHEVLHDTLELEPDPR